MRKLFFVIVFFLVSCQLSAAPGIQPGAAQLHKYLPLLKHKRVGVFANHASMIGNHHLVDELIRHHIKVVKIFAPEHGFRGNEDNKIKDSVDKCTGIPIVSLYGKKRKPTGSDLKNVDLLVFDIQDVGVRFYTYISSLQLFMEAAVEHKKPLIILDRPNPNGFYVDGPILDRKYKSFTGAQPIPIVYGMTMGEYAKMLVGEEWLDVKPKSRAQDLQLTIIPCIHYTHNSLYVPPIKPSPNLPNIQSIYLYPSIGLMEATAMSVGRGTHYPFQVYGHPCLPTHFCFIPHCVVCGATPRFYQKICHGWDLRGSPHQVFHRVDHKLQIKYLLRAYYLFRDKDHFFKGFAAAAGNDLLEKQIRMGMTEKNIRKSWEKPLKTFKIIRKKYLLYPDFE